MKFLKKPPVILLGIIFIIFSLQFFAMFFMGGEMPAMNGMAAQYMDVFFRSGYVWVVKILELVIGIMLLIPRVRAFALVLIAPIVVNIFFTEILIVKPPVVQMIPAFLVVILTAIGLYQYRSRYLPMVQK